MRHVLLLRGINLGARRRIPMAELRALLGEEYEDVATYVQSGNVVLSAAERSAPRLAAAVSARISEHFGFEVPVIARSRAELQAVIARDPIAGAAADPKHYQVTFLERAPAEDALRRLHEIAVASERIAVDGREIYSWHPDGIARSKLAAKLSAAQLGVGATSRNWTTVTTLARMAAG